MSYPVIRFSHAKTAPKLHVLAQRAPGRALNRRDAHSHTGTYMVRAGGKTP